MRVARLLLHLSIALSAICVFLGSSGSTAFAVEPLIIQGLDIQVAPAHQSAPGSSTSRGGDIAISFQTNRPTQAAVILLDQAVANYRPEKKQSSYQTTHSFSFNDLPGTTFQVAIQVHAEDGAESKIDDRYASTNTGSVSIGSPNLGSIPGGDQPCPPTCLTPTDPGYSGAGIGSERASTPFFITGAPPAKLMGPFTKICRNDAVFLWVAPQMTGSDFIILDKKGLQLAPPLGAAEEKYAIVFGLTAPPEGLFDPTHYVLSKYGELKDGQTYTAQLVLRNTAIEARKDQLLVEFQRGTEECDDKDFTNFLAENGIRMEEPSPGGNAPGGNGSRPDDNKSSVESPVTLFLLKSFLDRNRPDGSAILTIGSFIWYSLIGLLILAAVLIIYFFIKRRRLWGIVYDARTKLPVELAVVRLFDQEHHKLLETRVTSQSGRYSFLAEPGEYYLEVTKEGYHFPSRIVTSNVDNEYTNLYRGEMLKLGAGHSLIAPDIPVDSEAGEVKKTAFFRGVIIPLADTIRLPLAVAVLIYALVFQFVIAPALNNTIYAVTSGSAVVLVLITVLLTLEIVFVRRSRK